MGPFKIIVRLETDEGKFSVELKHKAHYSTSTLLIFFMVSPFPFFFFIMPSSFYSSLPPSWNGFFPSISERFIAQQDHEETFCA